MHARRVPSARRDWSALPDQVAQHVARLSVSEHAQVGAILLDDLLSEYDSRFLTEHLASLAQEFSPSFHSLMRRWAEDEQRHFRHIHAVYERHWGLQPDQLLSRQPDFAPLASLFEDEFSILCLGAYDELVTSRAYRDNLGWYCRLGPAYLRWARALAADEAGHYAGFLGLLEAEHRWQFERASAVIDRIQNLEGTAYAATFVLDHEDPVFTPEALEHAARILRRKLAPAGNAQRQNNLCPRPST